MPFGKSDNIDGRMAVAPTSLQDTLVTSWEASHNEDSMAILRAKQEAYDSYISDLRANGVENVPLSPYRRHVDEMGFADTEPMAIARWHQEVDAKVRPGSQIHVKSHDDLLADAEAQREEVRQRRARAAQGESGVLSGTTAFVGSMAGATSDPLVIGTLPLGAPWATGVLRTALLEAVIGGATEVPVQLLYQGQRGELGEEGSIAEAAANIGLAAAGAGVLGGAIKGGAKGIEAMLKASRSLPPELRTSEVRTAEDILERQLEAEAINPLEGEAGRAEHMGRMAQAERLMATDRPEGLAGMGSPASAAKAQPLPRGDIGADMDPILARTIALGREARESIETGKAIEGETPLMAEPDQPLNERLITSPEEEIAAVEAEIDAEWQRMLEEEPDNRVTLGDVDELREATIRETAEALDRETSDLEVISVCGGF